MKIFEGKDDYVCTDSENGIIVWQLLCSCDIQVYKEIKDI